MHGSIDTTFEKVWRIFWTKAVWQAEPPEAPGIYPVAARDGAFRGWVTVFRDRHGVLVYTMNDRRSFEPSHIHAGWWWSAALPPLPSAPAWGTQGVL